MATVVRIPITNVFAKGDYTGVIVVGPDKRPMNVLLDTGSSALALDGTKYTPDFDGGDQSTKLAQTAAFGDGSGFTGAVIKSSVTVGTGNATATLKDGMSPSRTTRLRTCSVIPTAFSAWPTHPSTTRGRCRSTRRSITSPLCRYAPARKRTSFLS